MTAGELRKSGLEIINNVPWGTHFCQFYHSQQDLIDILVPYFKAGLENNEFCMWITAEPLRTAGARAALGRAVPDLDLYIKKGQIEIIPHTKWYLLGGKFDDERVLNGWVSKLEQALEQGYSGLRLTGNTFWLERNGWQAFTDYEAKVNNVIGKYRMLAICTYCLDKCNGTDVVDVVKNHQFALIKEKGKWDVIESTIYKQAKEALRETEEQLRLALDSANLGTFDYDLKARIVHWDENTKRMCGIPGGHDPKYEEAAEFLHPDDRKQVEAALAKAFLPGADGPYEAEFRIIRPDGSVIWNHAIGKVYFEGEGPNRKAVRQTGINQDITERKKAEEALKRLNRELRALSDCNQAIVRSTDEQTLFHDICRIMCDVVGYRLAWIGLVEHDEAKSIKPLAWYGADNGYLAGANITWANTDRGRGPTGTAARTGKTDFCQDFITEPRAAPWRDRALVRGFHSSIAIPLFNQEGGVFAVLSLYANEPNGFITSEVRLLEELTHDLSFGINVLRTKHERNMVEEALRNSEEQFRRAIEEAPIPVIMYAEDGQVLQISRSWIELTDYTPDDIPTFDAWLHKAYTEGAEVVLEHMHSLFSGNKPSLEIEFPVRTAKGDLRYWSFSASSPGTLRDGRRFVVGMAVDMTDRKKTEQMKDEFISLVSHELRTPMTIISGSLHTAISENISSEDKETLIQNAIEGADSLSAILENLLELSRYQTGRLQVHLEPICIPDIAQDVVKRLKTRNEERRFVLDFPEDIPRVEADHLRVERILYNLVENAIKYSPEESTIKIFSRVKNGEVITSVTDEGTGIRYEDRDKIFRLFERLGEVSKTQGLGLGLVVCKRLVEAQGGRIWVESEPDKGSTFYFSLPLV